MSMGMRMSMRYRSRKKRSQSRWNQAKCTNEIILRGTIQRILEEEHKSVQQNQ